MLAAVRGREKRFSRAGVVCAAPTANGKSLGVDGMQTSKNGFLHSYEQFEK